MTRIPLGEFEQEVLMAILRARREGFSLEVRREIEAVTGKRVSRGAFYTTLERLEEKELVAWESALPPGSRRQVLQRKFSVTPRGLEVLRDTQRALQAQGERVGRALEGA